VIVLVLVPRLLIFASTIGIEALGQLCQHADISKQQPFAFIDPTITPIADHRPRPRIRPGSGLLPVGICFLLLTTLASSIFRYDTVSDRDFVNVAPLQLGEEVLCIHSARLEGEVLVTVALYLDARDLKSV
jgi:hypothetical protein